MARIKWERYGRNQDWRGYSPRYGYVRIQHSRKTKKWYLVNDDYTLTLGVYDSKKEAQDNAEGDTVKANPPQTKTVDVMLSMTPEGARKWLRLRSIPFTHLRALSGGGTGFRIRRAYLLDFRHYLTMDERARVRPARNRAPRRARVTARGRVARPRKRNPLPRGAELRDTFTLSSLKAVKRGGRVEKVWYQDARDNQHYYHDFDSEHGALMYLCESAALGKCVLIVSGDLSTPLWENAT